MISTGELREALRIDDATEDGLLSNMEAAAVSYVERKTGRYFGASEEVTRTMVGDGTPILWLPDHASAVASVVEADYPGDDGTTITPGADDGYVTDRRVVLDDTRISHLRRSGGHVWDKANEYRVTYTRGYAAGAEPADIRQAVIGMVTLWYEQRMPVAIGTVAPLVPMHVDDMLERWRVPCVR